MASSHFSDFEPFRDSSLVVGSSSSLSNTFLYSLMRNPYLSRTICILLSYDVIVFDECLKTLITNPGFSEIWIGFIYI